MGKIKNLGFQDLAENIDELLTLNKEDLLEFCSRPEEWSTPNLLSSFVSQDERRIYNFKKFLAERPMHWANLLSLLRSNGLDASFLTIPDELEDALKAPCILAIPHFGVHMLVPTILSQLIGDSSYILATGGSEGHEVGKSIKKILPNDKVNFLPVPDIWILRKLVKGFKIGNYPLIYPEISSSNDKELYKLELLGEKVHVPLGVEHLSRLCNANVLPVAIQCNSNKYELVMGPLLTYSNKGSIIEPLFKWIEELVYNDPTQWFGWKLIEDMLVKEEHTVTNH
ncbi:hypothetical protein ACIQXR_14495 [Peribacillus sp. NPDC097224]|uniref:LpxL/LpxP family acyltransferase n=1 Tax=unclassified Peribacillus TaxID=2675266 RepID=UPI0037F271ED